MSCRNTIVSMVVFQGFMFLSNFGSAVIGFSCCGAPALIFVTFLLLVFACLQCFFLFVSTLLFDVPIRSNYLCTNYNKLSIFRFAVDKVWQSFPLGLVGQFSRSQFIWEETLTPILSPYTPQLLRQYFMS